MILFLESVDSVLKNLKTILSNYEIQYQTEESRVSKSRYLYVRFSKKDLYKFRLSDHDMPTHSDDPTWKDDFPSENLAGFYDFREDEYNEAKKTIIDLLRLYKIPKRAPKPDWIDKIPKIYKDYINNPEFNKNRSKYADMTVGFFNLLDVKTGRLKNTTLLKNYYKYPAFADYLKAAEITTIPDFLNKIIKKYGVI